MFRILKEKLDDSWSVYYSKGLLTKRDGGKAKDGEIDFLLVHPERGIVCLETKGTVRHEDGQWQERKQNGKWERSRDPGAQITGHLKSLQRLLSDRLGWQYNKIRITRLVALTDSALGDGPVAPDLPREVVADGTDIFKIDEVIEKAVDYQLGVRDKTVAPGPDGVEAIHNELARDHDYTASLKDVFAREDIAFKQLTAMQQKVVSMLTLNPRVAITGCAGSGKTIIASKLALDVCEAGKEVLFVCFNHWLAEYLSGQKLGAQSTVAHFHGLCRELGAEAGLEIPLEPTLPEDANPQQKEAYRQQCAVYYGETKKGTLPGLLLEAIDKLERRFDLIVVDEAQDLSQDWFDILMKALRNEESSQVWLFLDDSQQLYDRDFEIPPDFTQFHLTSNCRNTKLIHEEVAKRYGGELTLETQGPSGRDVESYPDATDQAMVVAEVIERLIDEEDLPPQDIVVLSLHSLLTENSTVGNNPGKYKYVHGPSTSTDEVQFSSIKAFKGLERPVVIVCEMDRIRHGDVDNQLYVAFSRAKNHLVLVGPTEAG